MTRRELLRRAGIGAGAISLGGVLAACGIGGEDEGAPSGGASASPGSDPLTTTEANGEFNFANWPEYIDRAKGRFATIDDYEKETGTKVNYKEVINDNVSFFGTIQEPLSAGQSTEWDMIVVTDWLVAKMARLGYLEQLDHSLLPNFDKHAGAIYKDPVYDPNNLHSLPWQSGVTGIGYNPELTKRPITKFEDLFDPAFKGKVGMMTEMRDTMTLTLLGLGIDPQSATEEDAEKAQAKLLEQAEEGIVRAYYGNDYLDALQREDIWITMAWSGDIFQLQFDKPEVQFVVPEEGGVLWVDNMCIPQNAENPIDAMEFMNYVYDPQNAAQITAWVNYICPVPEVQDILLSEAKKNKDGYLRSVATSPLVFPTPEMEGLLHHYKDLDEEEEEIWNELFQQVVQG